MTALRLEATILLEATMPIGIENFVNRHFHGLMEHTIDQVAEMVDRVEVEALAEAQVEVQDQRESQTLMTQHHCLMTQELCLLGLRGLGNI